MKIKRREFIKLAGAAGVALTLPGCSASHQRGLNELENWPLGDETWVSSICFQCHARCGIRVRVVDGLAVKIEGNPLHPINRGGLCP
ncbi:MAG: twin-arginine translocation signal domain-containing protein, partial [bacterium]